MHLSQPLSPEQIETFKTEGYLVVRGLIDDAYINFWRQAVWRQIGGTLENVASWQGKHVEPTGSFEPECWRLHNHPAVQAIVAQLGGGDFVCGHDSCVVTWPQEGVEWQPSSKGHVDGYNRSIGWWPFMLSATSYVHDVEHGGGALQLWPQSHLAVWRHFRRHPEQIDFGYLKDPTFDQGIYRPDAPASIEFNASAGDVVFWHAFTVHNGSMNTSARPRIGLFTRWRHCNQEAIKYEIPENLWKYWSI